ncbi:hypothetical protein ACFU5O_15280 [Streptomyces sp. NPDC057445]|uniref:hypothetical protein n=1 Tax=Streptomyces sp. NPDC057445 TaxID=3346136 RepID=UPI00367A124C
MWRKRHERSHGEGPGRFKGSDQHGWSPDVDDKHQDNPSGHRSFHPHVYAPWSKKSHSASHEDKEASAVGTPVQSDSRSGEDRGGKAEEEGMRDTGSRGRSQRPSGSRDARAYTGVDPQDPQTDTPTSGH